MSERESITGRYSSWLAKQSPRSRWTTTIPRGVAEHQSRAARAGPNRRTRRVGTFGPVVVARFGEDCPVSVALLGGARCVFASWPVSYTHLRAHETVLDLVCRLLLE